MRRPFCFLLLLYAVAVDSFWLSQNRLAWNDSQTYCQAQCGTDLAIIRNASEWRAAQDLIGNETLIAGGFTSAPYQGSQRVWVTIHSPLTNAECAYFPDNENAAYETANCSSKYRFLCESCEGVLDKYILYSRQERGEHVDRECFANLNTTGASIHSDKDMASIASLCFVPNTNLVSATGVSYYCWIGLQNKNNTGNLSTFAWTDGSFFDYGSDSPGQDPWGSVEPSYKSESDADENCVQIRARASWSDWNDKECSKEGQFICNKPNEFCYADRWQSMVLNQDPSGDDGHFAECAFAASDDSTAVIRNKKWTDRNWPLKIEYVSEANYTQSDSGQASDIGVVVMYENMCNYLFIGLSLDHQTNEVLLKVEHSGSPPFLETKPVAHSLSSFDQSRFHQMDIDISSSEVGITFDRTFSHDFIMWISSDEYVEAHWVGPKYIAVMNRNVAVTGKSLFISGTPDYSDTHALTTCINKYVTPSASPTFEPTLEPTSSPTFSPTLSPTFEPTLEPSLVPSSTPTYIPSSAPTFYPTSIPTNSNMLTPSTPGLSTASGSTGLGSKRVEGSSTTAVEDSASDDSHSLQSASDNGPAAMLYVLCGILGCVVCVLVAGWYAMGERKASASSNLQIDHRLSFGKGKVRIIKPNYLQAESDAVELAPEPGRNVVLDVDEAKQDDNDSESLYSIHDNRDRQAAGNTTKGATRGGNESEDSESSQSSDIRGEHGGNETSGNGIKRDNNVLFNQADDGQDSLDDNRFTMG